MVHRTQTTNGIRTQESAYRDLPLGNLDISIWVRDVHPLQEGFYGDGQARLPIGVDCLPTLLAFERGVVGTVSFSQGTAMATPLRGMPTIYNVQTDVMVETSLFENAFEFTEGNTHDGSVEPSTFRLEPSKILNGNISVKAVSNINHLFDDLSKIGFNEISLLMFQLGQLFFGIQGLKSYSSFHKLHSFSPNMPSKICLMENSSFWRNNTYSEALSIHIDPKNVFSLQDFLIFRKEGNNLQILSQTEGLTTPTIIYQSFKPLVISILFNRNCNSVFRIQTQPNKEVGFSVEGLAVSGDIKLDGQTIDFITILSPSVPNKTTSDLNIERGVFLAN